MNLNDRLKMYGFTEIRKIPKEVKVYLDLFGFSSLLCVYCHVDEIINNYKQAAKQATAEGCVEVSNWITNELEHRGAGMTRSSNWRVSYETKCLAVSLVLADKARFDGDAARCLELIDEALEGIEELTFYMSKRFNELNRWAMSELRKQTREAMDWLSVCEFDAWYKVMK